MGVLRALHHKQVLQEQISHISGVSGGGWAAAICVYNQNYSLDELLDMERVKFGLNPTLIDDDCLKGKLSEKVLASVCSDTVWKKFFAFAVKWWVTPFSKINDVWVNGTWKAFFKPFGIPRNMLFAASEEHAAQISQSTGVSQDEIIWPRYKVPKMILNKCVYGPKSNGLTWLLNPSNKDFTKKVAQADARAHEIAKESGVSMIEAAIKAREEFEHGSVVLYTVSAHEVKTLYQGEPMTMANLSCLPKLTMHVKADSVPPYEFVRENGGVFDCEKKRYSLEYVAGAGWALSFVLPILPSLTQIKAELQPAGRLPSSTGRRGKLAIFGDAGNKDNLGIMALLANGSNRIISWLSGYKSWNVDQPDTQEIMSLFGKGTYSALDGLYSQNQVFPSHLWESVMKQAKACRAAGEPITVVLKQVPILENPFYGLPIVPNQTVDICFMCLDLPDKWKNQIPTSVLADKDIDGFPHLATIGENSGKVVGYHGKEVNLLSDLACWCVLRSWKKIKDFF